MPSLLGCRGGIAGGGGKLPWRITVQSASSWLSGALPTIGFRSITGCEGCWLTSGSSCKVLVGKGTADEIAKCDAGHLPWATALPTHYFFSGVVCWQPFGGHLRNVDLVIVNHQTKLLTTSACSGDPGAGAWGSGGMVATCRHSLPMVCVNGSNVGQLPEPTGISPTPRSASTRSPRQASLQHGLPI